MSFPSSKRTYIPVNGVLLLDKPVGLTSNHALIRAKRIMRAKKAGHTGTLDPFATGLLPLCFGEATKFSQDLLNADKTYETVVQLGTSTTTGDTEGDVLSQKEVADVTLSEIEQALSRFRGDIQQIPPMYSALKRDGKPLYEYARAGIELEREARPVTIHTLELLDYQAPFLSLRVCCSKGTYIRVLGEDIGNALGCGGHLQALRRTKVGDLTVEIAHSLPSLEQLDGESVAKMLQPVDCLLSSFSAIPLPPELVKRFMHGQKLALEKEQIEVQCQTDRVRVYCHTTGQLLGTAILSAGQILVPERLIANQTS